MSLSKLIDPDAPARPSADGFAVLPSGNFLINDYDGLGEGGPPTSTYREYSKLTGQLVPGGLFIDLNARFGIPIATGVAVAPDGQSLFFAVQVGQLALLQTDLSGNLLAIHSITGGGFGIIEDIAVIAP